MLSVWTDPATRLFEDLSLFAKIVGFYNGEEGSPRTNRKPTCRRTIHSNRNVVRCSFRLSPAVNVSHHLNVLRNSKLIRGKKHGRFVNYSLTPGLLEEAIEAGVPREALNLGCCKLELPCD